VPVPPEVPLPPVALAPPEELDELEGVVEPPPVVAPSELGVVEPDDGVPAVPAAVVEVEVDVEELDEPRFETLADAPPPGTVSGGAPFVSAVAAPPLPHAAMPAAKAKPASRLAIKRDRLIIA
jgi:hypothetical protein